MHSSPHQLLLITEAHLFQRIRFYHVIIRCTVHDNTVPTPTCARGPLSSPRHPERERRTINREPDLKMAMKRNGTLASRPLLLVSVSYRNGTLPWFVARDYGR
ncbi:hypothetical protein AAC387_Pa09g1866 [Persea americana]